MTRPMRRTAALAAIALVAVACGTADPAAEGETVLVLAAASLTDVFADLAAAYEEANPHVAIEISFAASSALREQILQGAPADVFASADPENMEAVAAAGEVEGDPAVFATNRMEIAVPAGNPGIVTGLADLADPSLLVGLCAEQVPCGILGRAVLDEAGVTASIDTAEPTVRSLLAKVEAGELDAGLVYATDIRSSSRAKGIPIESALTTAYPIAVLAGAGPVAAGFVAFVLSPAGSAILQAHGFGTP